MTENEATKLLIKGIASANQRFVTAIKDEATFMWQCIGHSPTTWGLGWYHKEHKKLYWREAEVSRRKDGRWNVYVHIYGTPSYNGIEPSRNCAIEAAEEHLRTVKALQ